jgi:hypothetical protein
MRRDSILWRIREHPLEYLSSKSISRLRAFHDGYTLRQDEELPNEPREGPVLTGFQRWVEARFKVTLSVSWTDIILAYSEDEADAFNRFYDLFEEFEDYKKGTGEMQPMEYPSPRYMSLRSLFVLMSEVRKRPPLFLLHDCLTLLRAYLDGFIRAGRDLNLPETSEERSFLQFTAHIEATELKVAGPSWDKILVLCCGNDCGREESRALPSFFQGFRSLPY